MPRIFVSHSTHDRPFIDQHIIPALLAQGCETWYSKDSIQGAQEWENRIRQGLLDCDWFLVVLSQNSIRSRWVKAEVNWALTNRPNHVAPVLIDNCQPEELHLLLSQIQYIDFSRDRTIGQKSLLALWPRDPGDGAADLVREHERSRPRLTVHRAKVRLPARTYILTAAGALAVALLLSLYASGVFSPRKNFQVSTSNANMLPDTPSPEMPPATDQSVVAVPGGAQEITRLGGSYAVEDSSPQKPIVTVNLATTKVTDVDLGLFKALPKLRELDLRQTSVTDAGLIHLEDLHDLRFLDLSYTQITDAGLLQVRKLQNITDLRLYGTRITGAGFANLEGLDRLESLFVHGLPIKNDDLIHLKALPKLELLMLSDTDVTDNGMSYLRDIRSLKFINLENTSVSDAGLEHLAAIPRMYSVNLMNCPVTNAGLAHLAKLNRLFKLDLGGTRTTDEGIAHLLPMTELGDLNLDRTQITDVGLMQLHGLRHLKKLSIAETKISQDGVDKLKLAVPEITIVGGP